MVDDFQAVIVHHKVIIGHSCIDIANNQIENQQEFPVWKQGADFRDKRGEHPEAEPIKKAYYKKCAEGIFYFALKNGHKSLEGVASKLWQSASIVW